MNRSDLGVPADTSPEADAEQKRLYSRMEPHERLQAALDMSVAIREVATARIKSREPGLSDEEMTERLIDLCYDGVSET